MYTCMRYIKVGGRFFNKGDTVDLSILSAEEISRLVKKGIVVKADKSADSKSLEIEKNAENDNENDDAVGGMTDGEARVELLEKITHAVAVRELKLLGAEFKGNASLESLVELIMENEEYENHFFDYIENHEL